MMVRISRATLLVLFPVLLVLPASAAAARHAVPAHTAAGRRHAAPQTRVLHHAQRPGKRLDPSAHSARRSRIAARTHRSKEQRSAVAQASAQALRSTRNASPPNANSVARNPGPRQATAEDFLAAAQSASSVRARGHRRGVRKESTRARRDRGPNSVATPLHIVQVIRPTTQRPQLPSIIEAVEQPLVLPTILDTHGHLIMPPPLRGSREILVHQNQVASDDGLGRIQDDADLEAMRRRGMLVSIADTVALHVDDRLPQNRRVCRRWTAQFLSDLSRAHYARFHTPLQLTSAVRTVSFQQHLLHINGNAAPAEGETASPHLTGQAVDLGKRGLSLSEIAWLRGYLLPLIEAGKVDVEEEFRQSCFHISVYRRYSAAFEDAPPEHYNVASRSITPTLAATLP